VDTPIRPAGPPQIGAVAAQLAAAFINDPVMCWMWPVPQHRLIGMLRLFTVQLRYHHLPGGGVSFIPAPDGSVVASAVWDPPGQHEPSTVNTLRSVPGMVDALRTGVRPAMALRHALAAAHPITSHWYLNKLATAAEVRGHGVATQLLGAQLNTCDATHTNAYLEATRADTVGYYKRFGFAVTQQIVVPGGGPTLWGMLRTPR